MATKRIQVTESTGIKCGRTVYAFDDIVTIDAELATMFIESGWAKDVVTGEQGQRVPGVKKIEVDSLIQKVGTG